MKTFLKSAFILMVASVLSNSCATILSGTKQDIRLNSAPSGAQVLINGKDMGLSTPCIVKLKRKVKPTAYNNKNEYHYSFQKEGYNSAEYTDYRRINPKLYMNAFTWLFIVFTTPIDFITGASYKYNDQVIVTLHPIQTKQIAENEDKNKIKNEDKQAPEIKIYKPDMARGFKPVVQDDFLEISGTAYDVSGIFEITINGLPVSLDANGSFNAKTPLIPGTNKITIVAKDKKMNTATESFFLERTASIADTSSYTHEIVGMGTYHALIIGVQDYLDPNFQDLEEPIHDAQKVYNTLINNYQFEPENIKILKNPGKDVITQELENYFNKLSIKDNLLIFYAGHGYWDDKFKQGYWLPADARYTNRGTWLSNSTIKDYMHAISCKHNLLITDACFAGSIFKSREAFADTPKAINELYQLPSRKAMTSGALNQVPDKSVFIEYLIKRLEENRQKYLPAEQLFASFKIAVINNSPDSQVPQFGEVKETGDEGGDFIFIRK